MMHSSQSGPQVADQLQKVAVPVLADVLDVNVGKLILYLHVQ